jgi:hypothetical protein
VSTSLRLFIREALEQITFMKKTTKSSESEKDTEETSRAASILSAATDVYNFKNMIPKRGGSWRSAWTSARGNKTVKTVGLGGAILLAAWAAGKFKDDDNPEVDKREEAAKKIDEILKEAEDILARERRTLIANLRTPELLSLTTYVSQDQVSALSEKFNTNYEAKVKKIQDLTYDENDKQAADYEEFFTSSAAYNDLKPQFDALIKKHAGGDQNAADAYKVLISRILLADLCSSIQTSMSRDVDFLVSRLSGVSDAEEKEIEEQMTKIVEGFDDRIDGSRAVQITHDSLTGAGGS